MYFCLPGIEKITREDTNDKSHFAHTENNLVMTRKTVVHFYEKLYHRFSFTTNESCCSKFGASSRSLTLTSRVLAPVALLPLRTWLLRHVNNDACVLTSQYHLFKAWTKNKGHVTSEQKLCSFQKINRFLDGRITLC